MSELPIVDLLPRISNPFIAHLFHIIFRIDALPDLLAQAVKVKNAMPPPVVVAVLEFVTQEVQKLNLLLARQRLDVLVVDVSCA